MQISKNILVAPLNWGLGHATRCIPIINAILENGDTPIIASDGQALRLLKKEFPRLQFIKLPSYDIRYAARGKYLKLKMLKDSPKIWLAMRQEHDMLQDLIVQYQLDGVISDNRLGCYSNKIPSVIITHQLQVLSGNTTWLSTELHSFFLRKFDYCWIPDYKGSYNLSGILSDHAGSNIIDKTFIAPLTRFKKTSDESQIKYDLLVLLSGPKPHRSILEAQLLEELKSYDGKILFIAGKVEKQQRTLKKSNLTYYNYLDTAGLQKAYDRSKVVLTRSGYSTIMDLNVLGKKAFFIPTPGQYEQEYLAQRMQDLNVAPCATQSDFKVSMLEQLKDFKGFEAYSSSSSSTSISAILSDTFSRVNENSDPIPGSLST